MTSTARIPQKDPPPPNPCEQKLGGIFGEPESVMRTTYDVDGQYEVAIQRPQPSLIASIGAPMVIASSMRSTYTISHISLAI
jgi:hypothetical protein